MLSTVAIDIKNLTIGYKSHRQLYPVARSINATIRCGEVVALVGRNGAGKSTLLRTICGYQKALSGELSFMGRSFDGLDTKTLSKLIAVVLTDTSVASNITVRELVSLGRTPHTNFFGSMRTADKRAVDWAMDVVGIETFSNRKIAALSDGERQKCMIAKALAQETPIIALDEPTAFLDYPSKMALFRQLSHLASRMEKAVIVSTHDIELAFRLCNTIWFMDKGALHCGTPDDLWDSGVLKEFVGNDDIRFNKNKKVIE